jgi:hypothetical protein
MRSGQVVDLAIGLYPGWWRERYAEEVRVVADDLAADGRSTAMVTFSLLRGAVHARTSAQGMPRTYVLWSTRTRMSIAAATLPWMLVAPFLLMAMGTQSLHSGAGNVYYSGFNFGMTHLQIAGAPPTPAPPLTPAGSVVPFASLAVGVLFLVTLAVLASGWIGLTGAIRRSAMPNRRRVRLLAWAPGFALLADIALIVAQTLARPRSFHSIGGRPFVAVGGHPLAAHVLGTVLGVVAIGGWLVSVACVAAAVKRADVAPSDLRFGKSVSLITTTLFALMLAAYMTWGVGLIVQARQSAHGNFTTIAYSHQDLWFPMVVFISLAVILSGFSSREARRSWRVLSGDFL